jgi:hypothetical protein
MSSNKTGGSLRLHLSPRTSRASADVVCCLDVYRTILANQFYGALAGRFAGVVGLLERNPPDKPPATLDPYLSLLDFTTSNGIWWQREQRLQYAPMLK